jgi:glycosyltransferase involved in cell wall biosynthesis
LELSPGTAAYAAFLGRIDYHQKGLDLLLEAAVRTGVPLRLAGDGPDRERLEREIATLPNVEYLGKLAGDAKASFLQNAAFLVLPSRFEGQMMVVTEAAAAGRGVITSEIPELRYVTEKGIGRSFSPYEPEALARAIRQLWSAPDQQQAFAGRARAYAQAFDWERLTDSYEQTLLRVCRGERPSDL